MPWCPSCRSEFRAGFTRCVDCAVDLVETLPPPAPKEDGRVFGERVTDPCPLLNEFDPFKIALALQILENNDIAVYAEEATAGSYMRHLTGGSLGGKMLYVDRSRLEEAQELLRVYLSGDDTVEEEVCFDADGSLSSPDGIDSAAVDSRASALGDDADDALDDPEGESLPEDDVEEPDAQELLANERAYLRRRKTGRWVVLGYLLAPFVLLLILKLLFGF